MYCTHKWKPFKVHEGTDCKSTKQIVITSLSIRLRTRWCLAELSEACRCFLSGNLNDIHSVTILRLSVASDAATAADAGCDNDDVEGWYCRERLYSASISSWSTAVTHPSSSRHLTAVALTAVTRTDDVGEIVSVDQHKLISRTNHGTLYNCCYIGFHEQTILQSRTAADCRNRVACRPSLLVSHVKRQVDWDWWRHERWWLVDTAASCDETRPHTLPQQLIVASWLTVAPSAEFKLSLNVGEWRGDRLTRTLRLTVGLRTQINPLTPTLLHGYSYKASCAGPG